MAEPKTNFMSVDIAVEKLRAAKLEAQKLGFAIQINDYGEVGTLNLVVNNPKGTGGVDAFCSKYKK